MAAVFFKNRLYRHKNEKPKINNTPTPSLSVQSRIKFVFIPPYEKFPTGFFSE